MCNLFNGENSCWWIVVGALVLMLLNGCGCCDCGCRNNCGGGCGGCGGCGCPN